MSVQRLKFHGGAYYHLFMVAEIESILHPTEHDVGIHTRGGYQEHFTSKFGAEFILVKYFDI